MVINASRTNIANAVIKVDIEADKYNKMFAVVAKEAAKNVNISGFRKGKVPIKLVKMQYSKELSSDTENKIVTDAFEKGIKELGLSKNDVIAEPQFTKYEKNDDNSMEIEMKVALSPIFSLGDYKSLLPEIKKQKVSANEVVERLNTMLNAKADTIEVKDRAVQNDDYVNIDFEGFIDETSFEGGKASDHTLHIGSKTFISNFEDQLIGAMAGDTKDVNVVFPDDYNKDDLRGKKVKFVVQINSIKVKEKKELNDENLKILFPDDENISVKEAKDAIKKELENEKYNDHFFNDLKSIFFDNLLKEHDFPLPDLIVEKELDLFLNEKVSKYSKEELDKIKDNKEEIEKLRDEHEPEAMKRVKTTFILSEIAKNEHIEVDENEVMQKVYMNALYSGGNPEEYMEQYKKSNMQDAFKMMIIEEKIIYTLFTAKLKTGLKDKSKTEAKTDLIENSKEDK